MYPKVTRSDLRGLPYSLQSTVDPYVWGKIDKGKQEGYDVSYQFYIIVITYSALSLEMSLIFIY